MRLFENILKKLLLTEEVSVSDVEKAIDNHNRVIINYRSKGEDQNTGARVIEVYAYGTTKAGNPCIRAFQPFGDTTSRVPSWKLFRLDRITDWQPTNQIFSHPADFYYKNLGEFNKNGDNTMAMVYKIASFDGNNQQSVIPSPKTAQDVYKTDTENRMERLKQQLDNPIKISDIKDGEKFKEPSKPPTQVSKPKTMADVEKTNKKAETQEKEKSQEEKNKELDKLRQTLKNNQPMSLSDLNQKMKEEPEQEKEPELYKTDTERNMERLRQQLQNPQKIDLSRIPRR